MCDARSRDQQRAGDQDGAADQRSDEQPGSAQFAHAPDDQSDGLDRMTLGGVFRDEEVAREPRADNDPAEDTEADDGDHREDRDAPDRAQGTFGSDAAPPQDPGRRDERADRDRPGFIAGHAGEDERPADEGRRQDAARIRPFEPISCSQCASSRAIDATLSAMRSGSVIGVDCRYRTLGFNAKTSVPDCSGDQEPVSAAMIQATALTATANDDDRDNDRRCTGPVERVDLHGQGVEQMRQRQPDRADLLPARGDAVEYAPRHHQMAAGIVVAQRQIECGEPEGSECSEQRRSDGDHR